MKYLCMFEINVCLKYLSLKVYVKIVILVIVVFDVFKKIYNYF